MPVIFESPNRDTLVPSQPIPPEQPDKNMSVVESFPRKSESMGAFILRPSKVRFATQGKNEHIILFIRKHPITQIPWILLTIILTLLPILLVPVVGAIINNNFVVPAKITIVLLIFWYMATFVYAFVSFIIWYYNINIVTNQRVIDIDFLYLLVQEVTATRITQVEDVTYKRAGSVATLYDYGDVFVQTAGTEVNIEFIAVPKPKQISKIIVDLMGQV